MSRRASPATRPEIAPPPLLPRRGWLFATLLATACGGARDPLVELTALDPGDQCAAGGVVISSGVDQDRDGGLDAEEITSAEVICDGVEVPGMLVVTTVLGSRSDACFSGGIQIDAGADDGTPGGVAGDGVLQADEIDATTVVCNGDDLFEPEGLEEPTGNDGAYVVDMRGGRGLQGDGAEGGYLYVEIDDGTYGGGIRLFRTGEADASFAFPSSPAVNLGDVPATVTGTVTVSVVNGPDGVATGDLYRDLTDQPTRLRRKTATGNEIVTGLEVASGATLTFAQTGGNEALTFSNDVHVIGTLQTAPDAGTGSRPGLRVSCYSFVGDTTGRVVMSGGDNAESSGGNGGAFVVSANGVVVNSAPIDTSGGNGTSGGASGGVELRGLNVYNRGTIDLTSGDGSAGSPGFGGGLTVEALGGVFVSGAIHADLGSGFDNGVSSSLIALRAYNGDVRLSGDLTGRGGDITCTGSCEAPSGRSVQVLAAGGDVRVNADIDLSAGNVGDFEGSTRGGYGGYLQLSTGDSEGDLVHAWPAGSILVSGNLTLHGGNGSDGNWGGGIYLSIDTNLPQNQTVQLLGYDAMLHPGGEGTGLGGEGGWTYLETSYASSGFPTPYGPGGPIAVYLDDLAVGGAGGSLGGYGGPFEAYTDTYYGLLTGTESILIAGELDRSAGAASAGEGGWGGSVTLNANTSAWVSGAVVTRGGAGTTDGGGGGSVFVWSDAAGTLADVDTSGGAASNGDGGDAGAIEAVSGALDVDGDLVAVGGTGTTSGGDGGEVYLVSTRGVTTQAGGIDVAAGTGGTGTDGTVIIDGFDHTSDF